MYKERFTTLFEDMNSRNGKVLKLDCKSKVIEHLRPIRPDNYYKLCWDLVGMFFIFVQMITIPLVITFSINLDLFYEICNQIMDYYFLFDILVSFHTGYYYKGCLITSHKKVFWNYFSSWFFIDLISSFPYDIVIQMSLESDSAESIKRNSQILKIIRVVRFIKILRLIRALKLKKIINQLEDTLMMSKTFLSFLAFLRICVIILCLAHWLACIWNLLRQVEGAELNWYTRYQLYQIDNYIVYQDTNHWVSQYLVAIYFSITTMITIGYGDIYPITTWERLFGIIVMIFSSGLFGYVMNSVVALLDSQDENVQELLLQSNTILLYLKQKRSSKKLLARIKNYLEWLQQQEQIQKNCEQQVLENLSENLKIEILEIIHEKIITSCLCISQNFSASLQQKLVYYFKELTFSPEDIILENQDLENKQIFYILNGSVMIEKIQYELKNKQFFGEIGFFANIPRCSTIRATNFINLLTLNREKFLSILQPEDVEKYFEIKFQIEIEQNLKPLSLKCYVCEEFDHIATICPYTHYVISKYDKIKVVEKFQQQAKKQRNNKKKNKTLLLLNNHSFLRAYKKIEKDMLNIEYFLNKKKQMTQYKLSQRILRDKKVKDSFISETIKEFSRFTPKHNIGTIISIVNSKAEIQVQILEERRENERKERTKESTQKFVRMLQQKKQTQILAQQHLKKSRLSIDKFIKMAQNQLLRKPSTGDESRKRLLQVQELRKKNSKSFNQIESVGQIWINFPTIPEDAIECQAQELKQIRKKLRSSHASTTVTLVDEQNSDFQCIKPRRSQSQEKQIQNPSVFYSSSCLENMIYIVINHKLFNSK